MLEAREQKKANVRIRADGNHDIKRLKIRIESALVDSLKVSSIEPTKLVAINEKCTLNIHLVKQAPNEAPSTGVDAEDIVKKVLRTDFTEPAKIGQETKVKQVKKTVKMPTEVERHDDLPFYLIVAAILPILYFVFWYIGC